MSSTLTEKKIHVQRRMKQRENIFQRFDRSGGISLHYSVKLTGHFQGISYSFIFV